MNKKVLVLIGSMILLIFGFCVFLSTNSGSLENNLKSELQLKKISATNNLTSLKSRFSKTEFVKIGDEYDSIYSLTNVNDKFAYLVFADNTNFFVYDGKEYGREPGYDETNSPTIVNGKLAYVTTKDEDTKLSRRDVHVNYKNTLIYDGKEFAKYESIDEITEVAGKLAFTGSKNGKSFVVYDGKEKETTNDNIEIIDIGGKITYIDHTEDTPGGFPRSEFVVHDWKSGKEYDSIYLLKNVGGKVAYQVTSRSPYKEFLVYDGIEYGKEYNTFVYSFIGEKLAYIASQDGKSFIVYDGKEIGKEYDSVDSISGIDGKLGYTAYKDGKSFIVYDGKEIGEAEAYTDATLTDLNGKPVYIFGKSYKKDYKKIIFYNGKKTVVNQVPPFLAQGMASVAGKIAYIDDTRSGKQFVVYDGKKGKAYDYVSDITDVGGKLMYGVNNDNKQFFVYDGKEIGERNDWPSVPFIINGKLGFSGSKNGKTFIFYDGKEIYQGYDDSDIYGPVTINGKSAFLITNKKKDFILMQK